jgi:AAA+ superfamily predicted ATPase
MTEDDARRAGRKIDESERRLREGDVSGAQDGLIDAARQLTRRAQELDQALQERQRALADELWARATRLGRIAREPLPEPFRPAGAGRGAIAPALAEAATAARRSPDEAPPPAAAPSPGADVSPKGLDDLTGADELKATLRSRFVLPLRDPARAALYKQRSAGGALLYGPPGAGKTYAVRALAAELGVPTYSIAPAQIVSKWLGDSEKRLAELLREARSHPVALVFVDEIDALAGGRDGGADSGGAMQRLLTQLLTELDGFTQHPGCVLFIGATNRPWAVDPALLRPGRIDTLIHVGLPSAAERALLLARHLEGVPIEAPLDFDTAAAALAGCSAAETAGCANAAARFAFEDALRTGKNRPVRQDDVLRAARQVHRACSAEMLARYDKFARDHGHPSSPAAPASPAPPPAPAVGSGRDVAIDPAAPPVAPIAQIRASDLRAEIQTVPFVCYALQHVGVHLVRRLSLHNDGAEPSQNLVVELALVPEDFGSAWTCNIAELAAGDVWSTDNVSLPLRLERLRAVAEKQLAHLRLTVRDKDEVLLARMIEVPVLAYNEWLHLPEFLELTAAFVQPNDPALAPVVAAAADRLEQAGAGRAFNGYQSGSPEQVLQMLDAVHRALADDVELDYIDPPPSFERTGQKVRLVAQTLESKRGTCFDLAILQAALWEHIGLAPCLLLIPGHALLGCWTTEPPPDRAPVVDLAQDDAATQTLRAAQAAGRLLFVNSVEATSRDSLDAAVQAAQRILARVEEQGAPIQVIDIAACRRTVTPLP